MKVFSFLITLTLVIVITIGLAVSNSAIFSYFRFTPNHIGVDRELAPYVQDFIDQSRGKVVLEDLKGLTIGFRSFNKKNSAVGLCYMTPTFKEIDISIDWWTRNTNRMVREELIFHELGHCVLHRAHTLPTSIYGIVGWFESFLFKIGILKEKKRLPDGCPASYMHPNVLGFFCMYRHRNYYIDELFNN